MGYNVGKVSKPVSIYDVQRALGTSETDLGSLCAHDNLNMWAKYKPIITDNSDSNKVDAVTLAQRASVNYGISDIPMWNRIDYMLPFIFGNRSGHAPTVGDKPVYWTYRKPYGKGYGSPGDTDYKGDAPFRLTDFADPSSSNGYFQNAERPFTGIQATEYTYDSSGYFRINYGMGAQDNLTIKLNELNFGQQISWGSMYFGVALCPYDANGNLTSNYYVTTQYATGSEGTTDYNMDQTPTMGFWVNIYNNSLPSGVYKIFPIVSGSVYHFASSQFGSSVKSICLLDPNDGGDIISVGTSVFELTLSMFRLYRKFGDNQFIYGDLDIMNLNAVASHYTILLEIFNSSGTLIASRTIRPANAISAGGNVVEDLKTQWQQNSAAFDTLTDNNIRHADSARVTVTPTESGLTNPRSTTMVCVVGDRSQAL